MTSDNGKVTKMRMLSFVACALCGIMVPKSVHADEMVYTRLAPDGEDRAYISLIESTSAIMRIKSGAGRYQYYKSLGAVRECGEEVRGGERNILVPYIYQEIDNKIYCLDMVCRGALYVNIAPSRDIQLRVMVDSYGRDDARGGIYGPRAMEGDVWLVQGYDGLWMSEFEGSELLKFDEHGLVEIECEFAEHAQGVEYDLLWQCGGGIYTIRIMMCWPGANTTYEEESINNTKTMYRGEILECYPAGRCVPGWAYNQLIDRGGHIGLQAWGVRIIGSMGRA